MTPNSPASRATHDHTAGHRRTGLLGIALVLALTVTWVVFAMPSSADHAPEACTTNQQQGTLCLTVSDTPDPVAPSGVGSDSYISYEATLRNASNSNLSHIGLSDVLPQGTTLFRVTPSSGTCSGSGPVNCAIGSLPSGSSATVEVVVTAPTTEGTITNEVTATFDEDSNGGGAGGGGKQATVPYSEPTLVSQTAGETFVPTGGSGQVGATDLHQSGKARINHPSTDVLASIDLLAPDSFCVKGTVKVGQKTYVCRNGGFVSVSVVHADDPTVHYSDARNPLVFHLEWDGSLTSTKQTVKNFVVFYQSNVGSTTQVISTRCNATASNLPCLRNVSPLTGGGISADLVKQDNGRMR